MGPSGPSSRQPSEGGRAKRRNSKRRPKPPAESQQQQQQWQGWVGGGRGPQCRARAANSTTERCQRIAVLVQGEERWRALRACRALRCCCRTLGGGRNERAPTPPSTDGEERRGMARWLQGQGCQTARDRSLLLCSVSTSNQHTLHTAITPACSTSCAPHRQCGAHAATAPTAARSDAAGGGATAALAVAALPLPAGTVVTADAAARERRASRLERAAATVCAWLAAASWSCCCHCCWRRLLLRGAAAAAAAAAADFGGGARPAASHTSSAAVGACRCRCLPCAAATLCGF